MLRYLREARIVTGGRMRWGILTNGARWRLYHTEARSVAAEFFEVDLDTALNSTPTLFDPTSTEGLDALTLFVLFFRRDAFGWRDADGKSIHEHAVAGRRFFEEEVAADLSNVVFDRVFPSLVREIAAQAPDAPLSEVRDAALILLYRLLFILYAEDRGLLPVNDDKYAAIGLRHRVRSDIAARIDRGATFSEKATSYWHAIADLSRVVDEGDPAYGLPPYNGGLFDQTRAPLLNRVALGNSAVADIVDAMAFREAPEGRRYISYRDLSVQQLGSIYERLLEREVVRNQTGVIVRPNALARKDSGSYYTPESLVRLIIRETVGPKVEEVLADFRRDADRLLSTGEEQDVRKLESVDAAAQLLDLKICDPAMGSGHFLVSLLDYLTDRVIEALGETHEIAPGYESPVAARIMEIRKTIRRNATAGGWTIEASQLDDRHLIRRMVLKRCVHGVDKNPMAVELAKVSLWLHSFTVGAPLGFLDHHLRCGDSLFGSWARKATERAIQEAGPLFVSGPVREATEAARPMEAIEALPSMNVLNRRQFNVRIRESQSTITTRWKFRAADGKKSLKNLRCSTSEERRSCRVLTRAQGQLCTPTLKPDLAWPLWVAVVPLMWRSDGQRWVVGSCRRGAYTSHNHSEPTDVSCCRARPGQRLVRESRFVTPPLRGPPVGIVRRRRAARQDYPYSVARGPADLRYPKIGHRLDRSSGKSGEARATSPTLGTDLGAIRRPP